MAFLELLAAAARTRVVPARAGPRLPFRWDTIECHRSSEEDFGLLSLLLLIIGDEGDEKLMSDLSDGGTLSAYPMNFTGYLEEKEVRRELKEETGYGGGTWHALGALHPAASRFNNQVHSFLALDVTKVTAPAQHESETLHLHEIPWVEFVDGLRAGRLRLPEANQMSSLLLLHLLAQASGDPTVQRLKL